jgi:chemotaxis family two-component system response regulator Rcp1
MSSNVVFPAVEAKPIEILLVEDNPGDVDLILELLRGSKIRNRVTAAKDGVEALDVIYRRDNFRRAPRPDLILLDLNLPRKDGREVLKELKSGPETCRIPIVILTTSQADQDILKSYQYHANCYVTKPVDLKQFMKVVATIEDFWLTVVKLPPDHMPFQQGAID